MSKPVIGKFSLKNDGGFVCKLQFTYVDDNGNKNHVDGLGNLTLGCTDSADPGDYGVPDGADVSLYVFVVWGTDNEAKQTYTYKKGSGVTANYVISGTTLSNTLAVINLQ